MKSTRNRHSLRHPALFACAIATLTLHGCGTDDLRKLNCTGIDSGASVVGNVRTARQDKGLVVFEAERLNPGISGLFSDPVFRITINGFEFEPGRVAATPETISGRKERGEGGDKDIEAGFSFDRRNLSLKYHFSVDSTEPGTRQSRRDTMEFEGACKKEG